MFKNWKANNARRENFAPADILEIPRSKWGYLRNLKRYGKTTQNSIPTPETPIPITGIPPQGNTTACGENFFCVDTNYTYTQNGVTHTWNTTTQEYRIQGTSTANANTNGTIRVGSIKYSKNMSYQIWANGIIPNTSLYPRLRDAQKNLASLSLSAGTYNNERIGGVGGGWISDGTIEFFSPIVALKIGDAIDITLKIMLSLQANDYTPYIGTTTPYTIEGLDGTQYTTYSLPDGTRDLVDWDRDVLLPKVKRLVIESSTTAPYPLSYWSLSETIAQIYYSDKSSAWGIEQFDTLQITSSHFSRGVGAGGCVVSKRPNDSQIKFYVLKADITSSGFPLSDSGIRQYIDKVITDTGRPIEFLYPYSTEQAPIPLKPLPKIMTVQSDTGYVFDSTSAEISANAISYGG